MKRRPRRLLLNAIKFGKEVFGLVFATLGYLPAILLGTCILLFIATTIPPEVNLPSTSANALVKEIRHDLGPDYRDWLYKYQTLVTGALAIYAAIITVLVMRKTDERAEARHQQLMKLSIRSDRLKIERMLVPHLAMLEWLVSNFSNLEPVQVRAHEDIWTAMHRVASHRRANAHEIITIVESRNWHECDGLLDGYTSDLMVSFRTHAHLLGEVCDEWIVLLKANANPTTEKEVDATTENQQFDDGWTNEANLLIKEVEACAYAVSRHGTALVRKLDDLADEYEIHIP